MVKDVWSKANLAWPDVGVSEAVELETVAWRNPRILVEYALSMAGNVLC
jgi:hypothetical protein